MIARVRVAGVLVAGVLVALLTPGTAAQAQQPVGASPLMFVVDISSSMSETDQRGTVKLEAAQQSLVNVIRGASERQPMGMWTYPGEEDSCNQGELRQPATTGVKDALDAEIRALTPDGDTPTAQALRAAVEDMRSTGNRGGTVVLVSDGESNCEQDPCEVAEQLAGSGFELQVHSVGFDISDEGKQELECIADATGGRYFDVAEGDELGETLDEITSAQLDLQVDAPEVAAPSLTVGVTGRAANPGVSPALNVTMAIQVRALDGGKPSGFVGVAAPVAWAGNLGSGSSTERSWSVPLPPDINADEVLVKVTAKADGAPPAVVEHRIKLREGVSAEDVGPPLATASRSGAVAVLGDSYISGEGAHEYIDGTDTKRNKCHRSKHTYGKDLFGDRRKIIACSGAVTGDFTAPQHTGDGDVPPQLKELERIAGRTELVLLSIGGNDIGFSAIVKSCLLPGDCDPLHDDKLDVEKKLRSLSARLLKTYRALHASVNGADEVSQRDGRVAPIVVLAYPAPFSLQDTGGCSHLSRTEIERGDEVLTRLNGTVRNAVTKARAAKANVYFAEDTADAFRPDHTICSEDPYTLPVDINLDADFKWDMPPVSVKNRYQIQEYVHPTKEGYTAATGALVRWSHRQLPPPTGVGGGGAPDYAEPGEPQRIQAGDDTSRGDAVQAEADGFAPAQSVTLGVSSQPRALATGYSDDRGGVRLTGVIPTDLPVGSHNLTVTGLGADGKTRRVDIPVDVQAPMPWWSYGFLVVGAIALSGAGYTAWRR